MDGKISQMYGTMYLIMPENQLKTKQNFNIRYIYIYIYIYTV